MGTGPVAWDCRERSWLVQEGKEEEMVEGGIRLGSGRNRQVVPRATCVGSEQLFAASLTLDSAHPQPWAQENAVGSTRQVPVVVEVAQPLCDLFSWGHEILKSSYQEKLQPEKK